MVRQMMKKSALLLITGALAGAFLLTLAFMLPVNMGHKAESMEILEKEGWYPRATVTAQSWDTYFHSYLPDVMDDSTDRIMLYTALDTGRGNPLRRAMNAYNEFSGDYAYYWHGYVCILRPLLLLFDYSELRILNGICQLLLILLLAYVIGKERGIGYVLMLGSSYLLLNPSAMTLSLQYTWVFYIAFLGTLLMVKKRVFFSQDLRYVYFFLVMGMLTSYFDLLTFPLITWGVPLVWWLVTDGSVGNDGRRVPEAVGDREKASAGLKRVVVSGVGWIVGYAFMWIMKWILATIVLGRNVIKEAVYEVFFRLGAQAESRLGLADRMEVIYSNWKHYGYKLYAMILLAWLVWWFLRTLKYGLGRSLGRYAYLLTGLSGIVWYFALANHTQGHHFFTYRIFCVSILAFFAIVLEGGGHETGERSLAQDSTVRGVFRRYLAGKLPGGKRSVCFLWAAAALLSIPFALLAREEVSATNGGASFQTLTLSHGAVMEADFKPTFDQVGEIGLGLECLGQNGEYDIMLWEGDTLRYQHVLSIGEISTGKFSSGEFSEGEAVKEEEASHYRTLNVAWKLDHRVTYRLVIQARGNDAPVSLWVTKQGEMPLIEYGGLSVDGVSVEGQLLTGITYTNVRASNKTLLFLAFTWTGIWMAVLSTFWPEPSKDGSGKEFWLS
jgi:hypothetical protein